MGVIGLVFINDRETKSMTRSVFMISVRTLSTTMAGLLGVMTLRLIFASTSTTRLNNVDF